LPRAASSEAVIISVPRQFAIGSLGVIVSLCRTYGRKALAATLLLSCLVLAAALRLSFVDSRELWVDEAESSINALTILERGYPADRYLGLPIYENVLLTTTPDSEEYEFKDSSYSDRGMAIYHAWLPLYSIAAAFALAGIGPDHDDGGPPTVRHGSSELLRRTVVPRLPSVVFAVLFLICTYHLGRAVAGYETAWALLVATAFAQPFVGFGWQARYYSATLAFTALSGLSIWNLTTRSWWRDFAAAGCALLLLFHTHSVSFVILTALLVASVPWGFRQPRYFSKLCVTGAIVCLGIAPWMYWTGFLHEAAGIPSAWPLLAFPHHFVLWFATRKAFVGTIGLVMAFVFLSAAWSHRRSSPLVTTAATYRPAFFFAAMWFVLAYLGFIFLIPAASFYLERLTLVVAVPGYLLFALSIAVTSRTIAPRHAVIVSPLLVLMLLGGRGTMNFGASHRAAPNIMRGFVELASRWKLAAGTKLYAFPNGHLLLTYYLGLPVQSIAPVRKSFLDEYPGDIVLFETGTPYFELAVEDVRAIGKDAGTALSAEAAQHVNLRVQRYAARQYLEGRVAHIWPPWEPMGRVELAVLERCQEHTRQWGEDLASEFPLFQGFTPSLLMNSQWVPVQYWFVNPERRIGDYVNYRDRIRSATGLVLPNGSIVFDSRRNRDIALVDPKQYPVLLHIASFQGPFGSSRTEDRR